MNQYRVTLSALSPLIMHADNLAFCEKVKAWQKDPANKELSVAGDDRSPAWTWIGSVYHDGRVVGIPSDNLMTMLREGGAKVVNRGKETYKKQTQAGLMIDAPQWDLRVAGNTIDYTQIKEQIGENDFAAHLDLAESLGFELLVKRARINAAKHVRVRPLFRDWTAIGSLTVFDEEVSGLTKPVIQKILDVAGSLVGLGDWRPTSPKSSGTFGRFQATVEEM